MADRLFGKRAAVDEDIIVRAADDPFLFFSLLYIKYPDGIIRPWKLNPLQKKLTQKCLDKEEANLPVKLILLKNRQVGGTTWAQAMNFWKSFYHPSWSSKIISYRADSSRGIYQIYRRFLTNMPSNVPVGTDYDSENKVVLSDTKSDLTIATAGDRKTGRSFNSQFLHLSEAAMYPDGKEINSGISSTVHDVPGVYLILESTPNGKDALFHATWEANSKSELDDFERVYDPIFFSWKDDDRARSFKHTLTRASLTKEEKTLMDLHKLGMSQIAWRRREIVKYNDDIDSFNRENPLTPELAFATVASQFFEARERDKVQASLAPPQDHVIDIQGIEDAVMGLNAEEVDYHTLSSSYQLKRYNSSEHGSFDDLNARSPHLIQMWNSISDSERSSGTYRIGMDISYGKPDGDWSVLSVLDEKTGEFVARYRAKIALDALPYIACIIGHIFNEATIIPEANGVGSGVIRKMLAIGYPRIYRRIRDVVRDYETPTEDFGWLNTHNSKIAVTDRLKSLLGRGSITERDERAYQEMKQFQETLSRRRNPIREAISSQHDDIIMSMAIATVGFNDAGLQSIYKSRDEYYGSIEKESRGDNRRIIYSRRMLN